MFVRRQLQALLARLDEPRRFLQVVVGPRQVGKTTLVEQALERLALPFVFVTADEPSLRDRAWIAQQWESARKAARANGAKGAVLVLDEVQKLPDWSESVKRLWDEDTRAKLQLRVVLLGSAPLLVQRGLTESLAGRFELIHVRQWSFPEMQAAFRWKLDKFLVFGGYPGAAPLVRDHDRWVSYIKNSLIETSIARDVLLLTRVDKPALLRRLFDVACASSGRIVSYTKLLGQLHDAGNTTTLAHYLDLLGGAGMVTGLQKYSGNRLRQRGSVPKLLAYDNALVTASFGLEMAELKADGELWGRLVESAVGAHLANAAAEERCKLFYWRERDAEVDFVVQRKNRLVAIEVKSGRRRDGLAGMEAFAKAFRPQRTLLVGADGIDVGTFLSTPVEEWLA